jgi:hypothetical protein
VNLQRLLRREKEPFYSGLTRTGCYVIGSRQVTNSEKLDSFWSCGFVCFGVNFHAYERAAEFAGKSGGDSYFYSGCPVFESRPLHLMS